MMLHRYLGIDDFVCHSVIERLPYCSVPMTLKKETLRWRGGTHRHCFGDRYAGEDMRLPLYLEVIFGEYHRDIIIIRAIRGTQPSRNQPVQSARRVLAEKS